MLKITNVEENLEDGVILVSDEMFIAISALLAENNCFPKVAAQPRVQLTGRWNCPKCALTFIHEDFKACPVCSTPRN